MNVRALSWLAFVFGLCVTATTFMPWATYVVSTDALPGHISAPITLRGWGTVLHGLFVGCCGVTGALMCLLALRYGRGRPAGVAVRPMIYVAAFYAFALWMISTAFSREELPGKTTSGEEVVATLQRQHLGLTFALACAALGTLIALGAAWMAWKRSPATHLSSTK